MENCVFCKIISGEIQSQFVYQDDQVIAFHDRAPLAPVHVLIIPRLHISTLNDLQIEHKGLMGHLLWVSQEIARQKNLQEKGYRLIMNCGRDAGQEVNHLHFHLLGGRPLGELVV